MTYSTFFAAALEEFSKQEIFSTVSSLYHVPQHHYDYTTSIPNACTYREALFDDHLMQWWRLVVVQHHLEHSDRTPRKIAATTSTSIQIATEQPRYAENARNFSSILRLISYVRDDYKQQRWLDGSCRNLTSHSRFSHPEKKNRWDFSMNSTLLRPFAHSLHGRHFTGIPNGKGCIKSFFDTYWIYWMGVLVFQ